MTSRSKRILLAATTLLALVAFFWMRSVAFWRPVKVGKIDPNYYGGLQPRGWDSGFLPNNEQFAVLTPWDEPFFDILDLHDKSKSQLLWRAQKLIVKPLVSCQSPESVFVVSQNNRGQIALQSRDLRSGRLKRVYSWLMPAQYYPRSLLLSPDQKTLWAVDEERLFAWDVQSGRLLYREMLTPPISTNESIFVLSPDGTRLLGCAGRKARIWNLPYGKETTSWTINTPYRVSPDSFSPDGRVVIYADHSRDKIHPVVFVDAATGKILWQTTKYSLPQFFISTDEMFVSQKNNCQVLDLFTGRPKRELPFPRQSDGTIFHITPDSIYTLNPKGEILRWRAR